MKNKAIKILIIITPLFFSSLSFSDVQKSNDEQNQLPPPAYPAPYRGSYGPPPPAYYPSYPAYGYPGGYLPPGPTFPGEAEADRIYEQNQHPPR